jgi:hypothetical protein
MNKWGEILLGLILLIAAVVVWNHTLGMGFWDFGNAAWEFFKGGILWFVIRCAYLDRNGLHIEKAKRPYQNNK